MKCELYFQLASRLQPGTSINQGRGITCLCSLVLFFEILSAELDGRRRAKLGKLVQQAGFPHIKTFEGYVYDHISFPNGARVNSGIGMVGT